MKRLGAFAAGIAFYIKVMWLDATLIDEICRQIEVLFILGHAIQLDQGQFDFLMSGIAGFLIVTRAKCIADMVDILFHHVQKPPPARCLKIGNRPFQHVSGII